MIPSYPNRAVTVQEHVSIAYSLISTQRISKSHISEQYRVLNMRNSLNPGAILFLIIVASGGNTGEHSLRYFRYENFE